MSVGKRLGKGSRVLIVAGAASTPSTAQLGQRSPPDLLSRYSTRWPRRGHRPLPTSLLAKRGFGTEGEDPMARCALVCGAGGFIGGHLVRRLKRDGFWVRG